MEFDDITSAGKLFYYMFVPWQWGTLGLAIVYCIYRLIYHQMLVTALVL